MAAGMGGGMELRERGSRELCVFGLVVYVQHTFGVVWRLLLLLRTDDTERACISTDRPRPQQ